MAKGRFGPPPVLKMKFFSKHKVHDSNYLLLLSHWKVLSGNGCGVKILIFSTPQAGVQWLGRGGRGGDGVRRGKNGQGLAAPPTSLLFVAYPGISGPHFENIILLSNLCPLHFWSEIHCPLRRWDEHRHQHGFRKVLEEQAHSFLEEVAGFLPSQARWGTTDGCLCRAGWLQIWNVWMSPGLLNPGYICLSSGDGAGVRLDNQ